MRLGAALLRRGRAREGERLRGSVPSSSLARHTVHSSHPGRSIRPREKDQRCAFQSLAEWETFLFVEISTPLPLLQADG